MATEDLQRLVVSLEARISSYEKAMKKAVDQTNSAAKKIENQFKKTQTNVEKTTEKMGKSIESNLSRKLIAPFAGISAGLAIRELSRMTDTWTDLSSRVALATNSLSGGSAEMERISQIARLTYSSIEQTTEGFLRNVDTLKALGYTTQEVFQYTEAVNNALVVSGAKAQHAERVQDALGKAMALGALRGEELNTVMTRGSRVVDALAKELGVNRNELLKLGREGKITRDVLFAITKQAEQLREEAENMPATIADGFQLLYDAVLKYVGMGDKARGISEQIAAGLVILSDNFELVGDAALALGVALAGGLVGKGLGAMIGAVPKATAAIGGLVIALRAGSVASTAFIASLGPIGVVLGLMSAAYFTLSDSRDAAGRSAAEAEVAERRLAELMGKMPDLTRAEAAELRDLKEAHLEVAQAALQNAEAQLMALEASQAQAVYNAAMPGLGPPGADFGPDVVKQQYADAIAETRQRIQDLRTDIDETTAALAEIVVEELPPADTGSGGKTKLNEYERAARAVMEAVEAMKSEQAVLAGLNPLVNDYGYALDRARTMQNLVNAAQRAGIAITPQLSAEIDKLASAQAAAAAQGKQMAESMEDMRKQAQEFRDLEKDVMGGFIRDLVEGKSAADALANSLTKIADKLLDMALNSLFSGGGGIGGILGGLFGGFRAGGGPVQAGKSYVVGEKGPELFSPSRSGVIIPNDVAAKTGGAGASIVYSPVIDARGASVEAVARLEQVLAEDRAAFKSKVVAAVRSAQRDRMV